MWISISFINNNYRQQLLHLVNRDDMRVIPRGLTLISLFQAFFFVKYLLRMRAMAPSPVTLHAVPNESIAI